MWPASTFFAIQLSNSRNGEIYILLDNYSEVFLEQEGLVDF